MTGDRQPRFRLSTPQDSEAPKVVPFVPKTPKRTDRGPNPFDKPKPAKKPKDDPKKMTRLDWLPVQLDPAKFTAPATGEILAPAISIQPHIPMILDMLNAALRSAEQGKTVELSPVEWKLMRSSFEILATTLADLAEGSSSLEWAMALNSVLLAHLLENPNPDDAAKTKQTYDTLVHMMLKHIAKEIEND